MNTFRSNFPYFQNTESVYLDSAATTQKPQQVIDAVTNYLQNTANPGRNPFGRSQDLYEQIEQARTEIAKFFNTEASNLAFTAGVTDGMNKLAQILKTSLDPIEGEILVCNQDHKSTILPWKELTKRSQNLKVSSYNLEQFTGLINTQDLLSKITPKTKVIVLTHAHNVCGVINDIKSITSQIPEDIIIVLDSAQTVSHTKIDFQDLGIDFMLFSGHKMFALKGIGCLIASPKVHDLIKPIFFGGSADNCTCLSRLETGTPNTVAIISLQESIKFIEKFDIEEIEETVKNLANYCLKQILSLANISLQTGLAFNSKLNSTGIISFIYEGDHEELTMKLEQSQINIRVGTHCTIHTDQIETLRISLHAYNSIEDIDKLIEILA